jgi:nucleoside-diphosphate-sugar epimerase
MPEGLRFQAVHSRDVADAYVRAAVDGVRGSFNLAAEPVLDPDELARILRCRWRPVPAHALRLGIWGGFRSRVLPVPPELFDLLMSVPVMSTQQAHEVLGWQARTSADDALRSFLEAPTTIHDPATPPLASETSGPLRLHELRGGLGVRA